MPKLPYVPYTYYLKHKETGMQYYGVKYSKASHPDKFWKPNGYFTSSKVIKKIVEEQGPDAFIAQVRKTFQTKEEAVDYEQRFLKKVNAPFSPNWFNQAFGTGPYLDKFGNRRSMKGVPKSEEHKRKISEAHKGKKHPRTPEWSAKIAEAKRGKPSWNKGLKFSEEAKKKMSESRKGKKRGPMSEETKRKIGDANRGKERTEETRKKMKTVLTGRKRSEESKAKMSQIMKEKFANQDHWSKGKPRPEEVREKISRTKRRPKPETPIPE